MAGGKAREETLGKFLAIYFTSQLFVGVADVS